MLFILLTFPLCCTLDIEQCGRGRLLTGPFANEAIKSILPWLSKGPREQGKSSAVSANTKRLSNAAVRIHNRPCFVVVDSQSLWFPLSVQPLTQLEITGSIRPHLSMCTELQQMEMKEKHRNEMMFVLYLEVFVKVWLGGNCCAFFGGDKTMARRALLWDRIVHYCF